MFTVVMPDLTKREFTILMILVIPTVILGIYPALITDGLQYSVSLLIYSFDITIAGNVQELFSATLSLGADDRINKVTKNVDTLDSYVDRIPTVQKLRELTNDDPVAIEDYGRREVASIEKLREETINELTELANSNPRLKDDMLSKIDISKDGSSDAISSVKETVATTLDALDSENTNNVVLLILGELGLVESFLAPLLLVVSLLARLWLNPVTKHALKSFYQLFYKYK